MAKQKKRVGRQPQDLSQLTQKDQDILALDTDVVMKKYKMGKQAVYDRRYWLKKKGIEAAPASATAETPAAPAPKKRGPKPGSKRVARIAPAEEAIPTAETAPVAEKHALVVVQNQIPVIHKPIEINFDNFSVRLNGVPKKISVNPETNAIEIDL